MKTVKVRWLGHASFLITSEEGLRIITDPYSVGGGINYERIDETADIVTVSHKHGDHNGVSSVGGRPEIVDRPGIRTVAGAEFLGIATYHDEEKGKQRGPNTIFCFAVDGVRVCHLGDLGHQLEESTVAEIGAVDVLLVPVGGVFTIDASAATKVCESLRPRVIIPMHFKTPKCDYPIAGVEPFLKGKESVRQLNASEAVFEREKLPSVTEIVVVSHAL